MKQTVLHRKHLESNARMTDYQGWQVPLQYSNPLDEYHAVRTAAGLFDIGCLGRIEISGTGSADLLQQVLTRDVAKIGEGTAHYSLICNESGLILDDSLIFSLPAGKASDRSYLLTTNAVNTGKILTWLKQHAETAGAEVRINDATDNTAYFSLQGPQSYAVLEAFAGQHVKKLKRGSVRRLAMVPNTSVLISRTGYIGEQGYELVLPGDHADVAWEALLAAGKDKGLLPCGFACRDVLRLEMGYPLYGSDIDETHTPLEAGLASFVDFKKDFIGRDALLGTKGAGQTLAGFVLLDKGVPKGGGSIYSENRVIGAVTSGVYSPHLRAGIGLGYVFSRYAQAGQEIEIEFRDRELVARIVDLPFYRKR